MRIRVRYKTSGFVMYICAHMDLILPLLLLVCVQVGGQYSCSDRSDGRCETCDCKPDCYDLSDEINCANGTSIHAHLHPPYWTKDSKKDVSSGQQDKFFPPPPLPPFPLCPESSTSSMPPTESSRTISVVTSTSSPTMTRTRGTFSTQHSSTFQTDSTSYSATSPTYFASNSGTTRIDSTKHLKTIWTGATTHSAISKPDRTTHFIPHTDGATSRPMRTNHNSPTTPKTSRSPCMRVAHNDLCTWKYMLPCVPRDPQRTSSLATQDGPSLPKQTRQPKPMRQGHTEAVSKLPLVMHLSPSEIVPMSVLEEQTMTVYQKSPLQMEIHPRPQLTVSKTMREEQTITEYRNLPLFKKTRPPMTMHPSQIASLVESFTRALSRRHSSIIDRSVRYKSVVKSL